MAPGQLDPFRPRPLHRRAQCCRRTQPNHQNLPPPQSPVACATTAATLWTAGSGAHGGCASIVSASTLARITIRCTCAVVGAARRSVVPSVECSMKPATMRRMTRTIMGIRLCRKRHDTRILFNARAVRRSSLAAWPCGNTSVSATSIAAACARRNSARNTSGSCTIPYAVPSKRQVL